VKTLATPNRTQILERATQMFMQDQARHPGLGDTTPEPSELKEAGYLDKAQHELMSNDFEPMDPKIVDEAMAEVYPAQAIQNNSERIEELTKQIKNVQNIQTQVMTKLDDIPNLDELVNALTKSKTFSPLGTALKPMSAAKAEKQKEAANIKMELIEGQGWVNVNDPRYQFKQPQPTQPTPQSTKPPQPIAQPTTPQKFCQFCGSAIRLNAVKCWNCGAPFTEQKRSFGIPECLKPKRKLSILDTFGAAMVALIWVASTGWILTNYTLSWFTIIGLGAFWLVFIVVFRLVIGGILD
jgi:hypothetical protein